MKNKINNYILISIFLFMIYIPTISYLFLKNSLENSNTENRELAEKPILSIKEYYKYPKEFDDYFNDNLPYRNLIINNWSNLNFIFLNETLDNRVIIGKDENNEKWLFYSNIKDRDELSYIDGRKKVQVNDSVMLYQSITDQTKKLKDKGIDLYYIVAPNKSSIYKEYLPKSINAQDDYFDKIYNLVNKSNLYYPIDLLSNNIYETYFRTDTHWNDYGSYLCIRYILNDIYKKEVVKRITPDISYNYTNSRDLNKFMGTTIKIKDNNYTITYPNVGAIEPEVINIDNDFIRLYKNDNYILDETVLVVGDSFSIKAIRNFYSIYKTVILVPVTDTKYNKKVLDLYKPSKLFYIRTERGTPNSLIFNF